MHDYERLQEITGRLYATFAVYPAQRKMWACEHCVTHAEIVALTTVPLRSLRAHELERYSFKALTTWGRSEDYRYFLPRLLELCVLEPGSYSVDVDTICRKLAYGHWEEWPDEERQVILDYLTSFWRLLLAREPYAFRCQAGTYLEALSQILDDLSPFLQLWRESEGETALLDLANMVIWNCEAIGTNGKLNWNTGSPALHQQVLAWLLDPVTRQRLEDGFLRYEACGNEVDEEVTLSLARAADTLFLLSEAGW